MPTVGTFLGYKFYFYSDEGEPLEPVHVHIGKNLYDKSAKVWIFKDGSIEVEYNKGIPSNKMNKLLKTIQIYAEDICAEWEQYFGEITYHDDIENDNIEL